MSGHCTSPTVYMSQQGNGSYAAPIARDVLLCCQGVLYIKDYALAVTLGASPGERYCFPFTYVAEAREKMGPSCPKRVTEAQPRVFAEPMGRPRGEHKICRCVPAKTKCVMHTYCASFSDRLCSKKVISALLWNLEEFEELQCGPGPSPGRKMWVR